MHKKKQLYYQRQATSGSEKDKTGSHRSRVPPSFEGKDPKDMSEEEKHQWKLKVIKDCEKQDDKIKGALDVL